MRNTSARLDHLKSELDEVLDLAKLDNPTDKESNRLHNITQDLLAALNKLLDALVYEYFETQIANTLETTKWESLRKKLFFPIADTSEEFLRQIKSRQMDAFLSSDQKFFEVIKKFQPYNSGGEVIKLLREQANNLHRFCLAKYSRKVQNYLNIGDMVRVSTNPGSSVVMENCLFNGLPVHSLTVNEGEVYGQLDPRIKLIRESKNLYMVDGTDVDAIELCFDAYTLVKNIAEEVVLLY